MPISTATAAAAPSYGARSVRKAFRASSWVDLHRVPGVTGPGCTLRTDGARFQRSQEEGTRVPGADQTGARGGPVGLPELLRPLPPTPTIFRTRKTGARRRMEQGLTGDS